VSRGGAGVGGQLVISFFASFHRHGCIHIEIRFKIVYICIIAFPFLIDDIIMAMIR